MRLVISLAVLVLLSCGKLPEEGARVPLLFKAGASEMESKAIQTNKAMGTAYDTNESFVVYAAFSESTFNASVPSSYSDFWDSDGLTCSYRSQFDAWLPSTVYYWPGAGYLTFQAYSPAGAASHMTLGHSWSSGFTFTNFTVPAAGSQYDLLYSARVENRQRSQYPITDGNGYDDDPDTPTHIYNGINLAFNHALSLIEVQTASALGSNASTKFYVQKIELKNAYNNGTFTQSTVDQSTGTWDVTTSGGMVNYPVLDKGSDWQVVPGSEEAPASVNPALTLMLLPQTLDRDAGASFNATTDAYLEVTYKEGTAGASETVQIPLTDPWLRGNKYTYKLVFSSYIEFTALITKWDEEIIGYTRIII
jgi:hypothetical protein